MKGIMVTGGAHGIGKGICELFLKHHYQVCFMDINHELGEAFAKSNEHLYFFNGDVKDKQQLKAFVEFAMEHMGSIDVLVNNACYGKQGILSDASYEDFDEVLSVGLKAPYELSRLCKEELKKNKGHIIHIASSRAFQSEPDTECYASAKGGIVALTHALAVSLAPDIHVNAIAPGWIDVNNTLEFSKADKEAIPVGKVGNPQDIAEVVYFLVNQTFITGETITVDGGMSKRMIYHGDWNWEYHPKEVE